MNINKMYKLYGEITYLGEIDYPITLENYVEVAVEVKGLEYLKRKAEEMAAVWKKVYFGRDDLVYMQFSIYECELCGHRIVNGENVYKKELKNF